MQQFRHFSYQKLLLITLLFIVIGCSGSSNTQEIEKPSALGYFHKGNSAFEKQDYQSAAKFYQLAIGLDSEIAEVHYNLGTTYYNLYDFQSALESYKTAQKINPNIHEIYYNLALVYYKLEKIELANNAYNEYKTRTSSNVQKKKPIAVPGLTQKKEIKKKIPKISKSKKNPKKLTEKK